MCIRDRDAYDHQWGNGLVGSLSPLCIIKKGQIMPRQTSTGTCTFCQGTFSKGTMTRHLSGCKQRQAELQASATRGTGRPTKILHLVAEGYGPYWLHLEVRADARLDTLDTF